MVKTAEQDILIEAEATKTAKTKQIKPISKTSIKKSAPAVKRTTIKKTPASRKQAQGKNVQKIKLVFQLKFKTEFGQNLFITGNHEALGNNMIDEAMPMHYLNDELWVATLELNHTVLTGQFYYNYVLKNADGTVHYDWGKDKFIQPSLYTTAEIQIKDSWNFAGYIENAFYTEPFQQVLLKNNYTPVKQKAPKKTTHVFKIKAPLLLKGQTLCITGSGKALKEWDTNQPVLLSRHEGEDFFSVSLDLRKEDWPIAYKYGVFDVENKKFLHYEEGNNRISYDAASENKTIILNDGFVQLQHNSWKGAGVAIPVFSIRTQHSFGTGEFADLKLLTDWSKRIGLKLIQLLPVNDTTATHSWLDSYPYAAISAFALHPLYINLKAAANGKLKKELAQLEAERLKLNLLPDVDYETVLTIKTQFLRKLYTASKQKTFTSASYKEFYTKNNHWLVPYAIFCFLRDTYGTSDFNQWPNLYKNCSAELVQEFSSEKSEHFNEIAFYCFVQYHLHLQLKEATQYAHDNGIIVKGDIAIGVYRYGADAWQQPGLYHVNMQAGAPPDDFAVKGQNWGFPTYNWQRMLEDGFAWWKQRFEQMSHYFDAFRIDHILGFFRIWSIPIHAVQGIMGKFVPAIPIHIQEFKHRHIWFEHKRYTEPYINEHVLWQLFGYDNEYIKNNFLVYDGFDHYRLKPEFDTQRKIEEYFSGQTQDNHTDKLKKGLFDLISNVILFEVENSNGQEFHFRFSMEHTLSFKYLETDTKQQLKELYVDYFFHRQDHFWMKEAMQKLPALKRVTNMLVCGEDLGMVPACVPDVMKQLGLLSLEIQRMPKDSKKEFFHPNDAPYLSVVTPSTHDMSTIRGWWEENKEKIQRFYNNELGQWGTAPFYCEAWINKAIVLQHLYSPAMWSIFQIQDLLGMNELLRRNDPNDERINVPANPKNYWKYRMHVTMEELLSNDTFSNELKSYLTASGR